MRNEKRGFNLNGKLDFCEKYLADLETLVKEYPDNALLWTTIANSYYYDLENYEKAFEAFTNVIHCDSGLRYIDLERIRNAAKLSNNDFFSLSYKFDVPTAHLYNALTNALSFANESEGKQNYIHYLELALSFGEEAYTRYKDYLYIEKGDEFNNQPHYFAMTCNNYAIVLDKYADLVYDDDEDKKISLYLKVADIHMQGYEISPFMENIENALEGYFYGKEYQKTIKYGEEYIAKYKDEMDLHDLQDIYWKITYSAIQVDDQQVAEKYYFLAKDSFLTYGKGNKDADQTFIYTAMRFYEYMVKKKKEYTRFLPEIKWYFEQEIEHDEEDLFELGAIYLYLGICYFETDDLENAKRVLKDAVEILECEDEDLEDEAIKYLKLLKSKSKKGKKSIFDNIKKIFN